VAVKFLVDAQLPQPAAGWLTAAACDAVHTLDLPDGNQTTDQQVIALADREQRVVVTKDADFVDSHILHNRPAKLLLISTGNIRNSELEALLVPLIPDIIREMQTHSFLEVGQAGIVIRG
jgi:predicted nuclease of predicted toxin-antitoxin system